MRNLTLGILLFLSLSAWGDPILEAFDRLGVHFELVQSTEVPSIFGFGQILMDDREHFLVSFNRPLRAVLQDIQSKFGKVVLDCTLFVEIAALLLSGKEDSHFALLWGPSAEIGVLSLIFHRTFGYFRVADEEAHAELSKSILLNKGQWVLKVGEDKYLGLVRRGLVVASEREWIEETKKGLLREIDGVAESCADSLHSARINLIRVYGLLGKLDQWELILRYPQIRLNTFSF